MRIVQLANFVSPTSGGIRTTIEMLRRGYVAAGHETALVIPGPRDRIEDTALGPVVEVGAPRVPGTGGYRMVTDLRRVRAVLEELRPDRIEVNDRFTMRAVGTWAARADVPAMVVVHERMDRLAGLHLPWLLRPAAAVRRDNAALAASFHTVVCPSRWAAEEFLRAGVPHVEVVGWGVDAEHFHPRRRSPVLRRRLLRGSSVLVVMVCRLSPEKRPESAVAALEAMRRRGIDARLVVAGTGRSERALRRRAADLPVTFLGHLQGRDHVAELLAAGDVAICPGPVETFGLAALEALASGTPVVSSWSGAIAELLREPYGVAAYNHGPSMASAAATLLAHGPAGRRAARVVAERHPWQAAVDRMLELHHLASSRPHPPRR